MEDSKNNGSVFKLVLKRRRRGEITLILHYKIKKFERPNPVKSGIQRKNSTENVHTEFTERTENARKLLL